MVACNMSIAPRHLIRKTIMVRPLGDLDYKVFTYDIKKEYLPNDDIDILVSDFQKSLTKLLDKHMPIVIKTIMEQ